MSTRLRVCAITHLHVFLKRYKLALFFYAHVIYMYDVYNVVSVIETETKKLRDETKKIKYKKTK